MFLGMAKVGLVCLSQLRPTFRVGPIEKWVWEQKSQFREQTHFFPRDFLGKTLYFPQYLDNQPLEFILFM